MFGQRGSGLLQSYCNKALRQQKSCIVQPSICVSWLLLAPLSLSQCSSTSVSVSLSLSTSKVVSMLTVCTHVISWLCFYPWPSHTNCNKSVVSYLGDYSNKVLGSIDPIKQLHEKPASHADISREILVWVCRYGAHPVFLQKTIASQIILVSVLVK